MAGRGDQRDECRTYLVLEGSLTRILIGLALLGHGQRLLLFSGCPLDARPSAERGTDAGEFADPLQQAMSLAAIVITPPGSTTALARKQGSEPTKPLRYQPVPDGGVHSHAEQGAALPTIHPDRDNEVTRLALIPRPFAPRTGE